MSDQIGVFKDKQHLFNFTSFEKTARICLLQPNIEEKKNYQKLELMVSLNNHIQSMFAGCINVFPLLTCKEYIFQYSVREFYQDRLEIKKKNYNILISSN